MPLLVEEASSAACRRLLRKDPRMVVRALTATESLSALCRLHRSGHSTLGAIELSVSRLERLSLRWSEVDAVGPVRDQAARLLRTHPLRAADALQLGAALVAADLRPRRLASVCLDEALVDAARREGFEVLQPGS